MVVSQILIACIALASVPDGFVIQDSIIVNVVLYVLEF
jgi:hypothetical protein